MVFNVCVWFFFGFFVCFFGLFLVFLFVVVVLGFFGGCRWVCFVVGIY